MYLRTISDASPTHLRRISPRYTLSEDLAALFGVFAPTPNPSKDLSRTQCFETRHLAPLVAQVCDLAAISHRLPMCMHPT